MNARGSTKCGERGASAVEFAIILTFMLLPILFGIFDFGRLFYVQVSMESATREIARQWAVAGVAPAAVPAIADEQARIESLNGLSDVNGGGAAISWTFDRGDGTAGACDEVGDQLTVSVTMPFSSLLPFLPPPLNVLMPAEVDAATTMRCERVLS